MTFNAPMLEIKDLQVSINENKIIKDLNLTIQKGEIHAIMGPNGSGKSTFSKVLAGHPSYDVLTGDILFKGSSILKLEPEERSHLGIFLAFQYPIEIPGVSNEDFLRLAYNSKQKFYNKSELDPIEFLTIITEKLQLVNMSPFGFVLLHKPKQISGGSALLHLVAALGNAVAPMVTIDVFEWSVPRIPQAAVHLHGPVGRFAAQLIGLIVADRDFI